MPQLNLPIDGAIPERASATRNLARHARPILLLLGSASVLAACATIPDATVTYYRPKAVLTVTVTQGVDCDTSKTHLFVANSIAGPVTYLADRDQPPVTFDLKQLDGWAADANVTFNLTDDGRLKGVNADSTGQGESVLKALIPLGAALGGGPPAGGGPAAGATLHECDLIAAWNGGKPITLTYSKAVEFPAGFAGISAVIPPDTASAGLYNQLKARLPVLTVDVAAPVAKERVVKPASTSGMALLELTDTAFVHVSVKDGGPGVAWAEDAVIPVAKGPRSPYIVPVPKPALFGKQSIVLGLSDAGAVTSLTYGKLTGAAGPANVASAAETAFAPKSAADRAADLKAQGDEIAQTARMARCRADPTGCT